MYARVLLAMAQFVLKIEKLSHIMGPTPILEMARAYGLPVPSLFCVSEVMLLKMIVSRAKQNYHDTNEAGKEDRS